MNDSLQLPIDVCQIQELLPHRYPFLLVDRVLELDVEAKRILAQRTSASTSRSSRATSRAARSCPAC